jgi:hypothetical protein
MQLFEKTEEYIKIIYKNIYIYKYREKNLKNAIN